MQHDTQTAIPAAIPPAPPGRPRLRVARVRGRLGLAIVATWVGVFVTLNQQRGEIVELRQRVVAQTEAAAAADARLSVLAAAESSFAARLDGQFDPPSIVRAAEPSVFTLLAGPVQGSAFVLFSDAQRSLLVTNFHVVRSVWAMGVRQVVVRSGGRSLNATVTSVQPGSDIAVIQVRASLSALATSATAPVLGQPIVVVGSPFGYGGTASTGIVSGIRGRYVQFSAPVSPGSSGGPVLDADGRVIGVTTAKVSGHGAEGLSFAIPIDQVCRQTAVC